MSRLDPFECYSSPITSIRSPTIRQRALELIIAPKSNEDSGFDSSETLPIDIIEQGCESLDYLLENPYDGYT